MIKTRINNEYKDIIKIFGGGALQKEITKVWSREANKYVYESSVEYAGSLPITMTADGNALLDYRIYGNTVRTGTPTPENPITPEGVGELETAGTHAGQYKLTILSNSVVTNIYLGEEETTRRIKKLVLTGEEKWYGSAKYRMDFYGQIGNVRPFCTHYIGVTYTGYSNMQNGQISLNGETARTLCICDTTNQTSIADWKSYLAAQYAAGTPVTVWYVLAEPETAVVNEPLMKIGNYADTLSMEQADVSIPTFAGATVIDYDGTPKPSQMYIKYRR